MVTEANLHQFVRPTGNQYQVISSDQNCICLLWQINEKKSHAEVISIHSDSRDFDKYTGRYVMHSAFLESFEPTAEQVDMYVGYLLESIRMRMNTKECVTALEIILLENKEK